MYKEMRRVVVDTVHRGISGAEKLGKSVVRVAAHTVSSGFHELKQVAKATTTFVKNHAATIASFAAGAAVFVGCEAITDGIGTVGCAALAGAVGNAVSYGMSCGSAAGGCTVKGALTSVAVGAIAGAVGGALAGPLGGKLASSFLGDVLPDLAVQGLTGATVGAAAGGAAGAASYGLTCGSSREGCSVSGLASATGKSALGAALAGGIAGAAAGAFSSAVPARGNVGPEEDSVLFGQPRIGENFSTKDNVPSYLAGRQIADVAAELRAGTLSPDQIPITAFEHEGQLVTVNNRGLAALSEAGLRPTNLNVVSKEMLPGYVSARLNEIPTALSEGLPSPNIAVTPSRSDWTVIRTISIPGW